MTGIHSRVPAIWPALLCAGLLMWFVWYQFFSAEALFMAATRGDAPTVKAVLDRGVAVDARDHLGQGTALIHAASMGHLQAEETITALLDRGADINAKNTFGNTALMLAAAKHHPEVVRLLLLRGAEVNAVNNRGRTAVEVAVRAGHADIVAILKKVGAK